MIDRAGSSLELCEFLEEQDIAWVAQVFPVDYILGFVETYLDVRERKEPMRTIFAK